MSSLNHGSVATARWRVMAAAIAGSLFSLLVFGGAPASAITMNNGDVVIYNFDFTGQTPSPPYDSIAGSVFFSGVNGVSTGSFDLFDAPNANGALIVHAPIGIPPVLFAFLNTAPGARDGIFSLRITAGGDPFDIVSVSARGFSSDGSATVNGELATPLPATLPLFAGGLGVIGLLARRKRRKTFPV